MVLSVFAYIWSGMSGQHRFNLLFSSDGSAPSENISYKVLPYAQTSLRSLNRGIAESVSGAGNGGTQFPFYIWRLVKLLTVDSFLGKEICFKSWYHTQCRVQPFFSQNFERPKSQIIAFSLWIKTFLAAKSQCRILLSIKCCIANAISFAHLSKVFFGMRVDSPESTCLWPFVGGLFEGWLHFHSIVDHQIEVVSASKRKTNHKNELFSIFFIKNLILPFQDIFETPTFSKFGKHHHRT